MCYKKLLKRRLMLQTLATNWIELPIKASETKHTHTTPVSSIPTPATGLSNGTDS